MSFLSYGHSQCKIRFYLITSLFYLSSKIFHVHNMLKTPQSCLGVTQNKVLHSIVLTLVFSYVAKVGINQSINQSINELILSLVYFFFSVVDGGDHILKRESVKIVAPIYNPDKVLCIGMNYVDHCQEQNAPVPEVPVIF